MSNKRIAALYAYVIAIVVAGAGAFLFALFDPYLQVEPHVSPLGVVTFIAVGLGLELGLHRLAFESAGGSIAFVAFLGAAVAFGPSWGSIITAASLAFAQVVNRRSAVKAVFNVAQYVLAIVAGSFAYISLGGSVPPTSLSEAIPPFGVFVLIFFFLNSAAVSGAIAISERRNFTEVWIRNTWGVALYEILASSLGLGVAWLYVRFGYVGVGLIVIPTLFMRHTYAMNLKLQETQREMLELMVKAIEARDPYTSGHSQRVAELARALARALKLSFREIENIGTAALLHDVGKIYEEFAPLLRKQGRLTGEEQAVMQTHPARSAELVGTISSLHGAVYKCVRHHHENFDGSGYPDGLSGEQIPLGARIIMVADTVDAMTTDRPYRKALSYDRVFDELQKYCGTQFDPEVVKAFRRIPGVRQTRESRESILEVRRVPDLDRVAQPALR